MLKPLVLGGPNGCYVAAIRGTHQAFAQVQALGSGLPKSVLLRADYEVQNQKLSRKLKTLVLCGPNGRRLEVIRMSKSPGFALVRSEKVVRMRLYGRKVLIS